MNPFVSSAPFLYLGKTSENRKVFGYFQGVEKSCTGNEWVNMLDYAIAKSSNVSFLCRCT